jgi:hypothetical protein
MALIQAYDRDSSMRRSVTDGPVLQPFVMFIAVWWLAAGRGRFGAGLMSSSPHRPAQPVAKVGYTHANQDGEQVREFGAGQVDQLGRGRLLGAAVAARTAGNARASIDSVVQRYQERGAADLVLIQSAQALAGLEALLDPPPLSGDADQGGKRDGLGIQQR